MRIFALTVLLSLAACGTPPSADQKSAQPSSALAACTACHSLSATGPQRSGPHLAGVIGRRAGSLPGYSYSAAMKRSDIVWTEAELDAFLANPTGVVPGTRMSTAMRDPNRREQIIAALNEIGDR